MGAAPSRHTGLAAVVTSGPQRDLLRYNRTSSEGGKASRKCRPRSASAVARSRSRSSQPASAGAA
ncbi:hypothetical protein D0A36_01590 [Xanthomonas campestris]|nr:hypothetical protein D0A41_01590 [Xanthomonas campestris]RFF61271.1 hypothetical protein D0A36_01590 [Xanthomonas campestris]RFF70343.1 hypothetical protein D0A39_16990 [Xanthomonas campestris pv. campestris]